MQGISAIRAWDIYASYWAVRTSLRFRGEVWAGVIS